MEANFNGEIEVRNEEFGSSETIVDENSSSLNDTMESGENVKILPDTKTSNKWWKNNKDMVFTILGIILIAVDLVSDITLAMDYCLLDTEQCFLTWVFVAGPYVSAFIIILSFRYGSALKGKHGWAYWKATEACFEAGPQLVFHFT